MCGRFVLTAPPDVLTALLEVDLPAWQAAMPSWRPRYNIAPTQPVLAVRRSSKGPREVVTLQWGLIPSWAKEPSIGSRMINARGETVAEKPSFRSAFKRRRCLVPASGFYEWQKVGAAKQPYLIARRDDQPFAFAGLWELWERPEGAIESTTIVTTTPNAVLAPIHDRMPVILDRADHEAWLAGEPSAAQLLIKPCPDDVLVARPVSTRVNSPTHDDAECIAPV